MVPFCVREAKTIDIHNKYIQLDWTSVSILVNERVVQNTLLIKII